MLTGSRNLVKYHFVNVFNAYRSTEDATQIREQKVDDTSTNKLFLIPRMIDSPQL